MRKLSAVLAVALAGALVGPSQAAVLNWNSTLSGSQEIPPNASTATGFGSVRFDNVTNVLSLNVQWQGLIGGSAFMAHIHCCVVVPPDNAGIALDLWTPTDPARPATGSYSALYDLDDVNPFRAGFTGSNGGTALSAMQALIGAMDAGEGRAYYNIHTAQFPGGEIRGNLAVPEPATLSLLIGGLGLLLAGRRFSRS
jgi:hypothetical protein